MAAIWGISSAEKVPPATADALRSRPTCTSAMPPWRPEVLMPRTSTLHALGRVFAELHQHAPGAGRMHEHVSVTAGADLDLIGHEARTALLQPLHGVGQVHHVQRHVMQSLATLGDEARDGGIVAGRFEQLDAALADGDHGDLDALVLDDFLDHHFHAQLLVKLARLGQRLDGDAEMIHGKLAHRFPTLAVISSTSA